MANKPNLYDYSVQVGRGLVDGASVVSEGGFNPDIDVATVPEDIWNGGGTWVAPTAARIHDIVSDDANDIAAGTGARTVRVFGLQSWDDKETSELIIMNGLTPVPTVNAYVMVNTLRVETTGTPPAGNLGDIIATAQVDLTVTSVITALDGQSAAAILGYPSTQTLHIASYALFLVSTKGKENEILAHAAVRRNPQNVDSSFVEVGNLGLFTTGNTYVPFEINPPLPIPGPAIMKIRVVSVQADDAAVGATFGGYLIDKV